MLLCAPLPMSLFFQPQHSVPDVFIWLISGSKRLAYQRISARHLLYSMIEEEKGKNCGILQTLFLKVSHNQPCLFLTLLSHQLIQVNTNNNSPMYDECSSSVCKGFDTPLKMGSSKSFKRYPTT